MKITIPIEIEFGKFVDGGETYYEASCDALNKEVGPHVRLNYTIIDIADRISRFMDNDWLIAEISSTLAKVGWR